MNDFEVALRGFAPTRRTCARAASSVSPARCTSPTLRLAPVRRRSRRSRRQQPVRTSDAISRRCSWLFSFEATRVLRCVHFTGFCGAGAPVWRTRARLALCDARHITTVSNGGRRVLRRPAAAGGRAVMLDRELAVQVAAAELAAELEKRVALLRVVDAGGDGRRAPAPSPCSMPARQTLRATASLRSAVTQARSSCKPHTGARARRGQRADAAPHFVDDELHAAPLQRAQVGRIARDEGFLRDAQLEPLGAARRAAKSDARCRRRSPRAARDRAARRTRCARPGSDCCAQLREILAADAPARCATGSLPRPVVCATRRNSDGRISPRNGWSQRT